MSQPKDQPSNPQEALRQQAQVFAWVGKGIAAVILVFLIALPIAIGYYLMAKYHPYILIATVVTAFGVLLLIVIFHPILDYLFQSRSKPPNSNQAQ